ncbi:PAS domain S-box protein [Phormidium sp. CCY1219]|uniref:PAS domain S-box protein n=1 Tax=Phormidium sp. CCY1219 TaxID=2886104 RepID=UPI002D1F297A|nr:PAS domain S-box protein [Phormidium sp. CCY1219]MEB3831856.1 PAS domain S-box protein [Phormidium sp. CCY1219]
MVLNFLNQWRHRCPSLTHSVRKVPLRTVLIVPFVLQIVGAVALVGYLSYRNSQQAVEEMAEGLMVEVSKRIGDRLDSYLETPQQVVAANQMAVEFGIVNLDNFELIRQELWQQMQLYPSLSSNYFLSAEGKFIYYGRAVSEVFQDELEKHIGEKFPLGTLWFGETQNSDPTLRRYYLVDERGQLKQLFLQSPTDYRSLPWYIDAQSSKEPTWSSVFVYENAPVVAIAAIAPIQDKTGQLKGVFISDYPLFEVSYFLNKLDFSPSGQAFIIEKSGKLIANSALEKLYLQTELRNIKRFASKESKDDLTQKISQHLFQEFRDLENLKHPYQLILETQKSGFLNFPLVERIFVRVVPYSDEYGLDWLIAIAVPESDFMRQIHHNTRITILLCVFILILVTCTGIFTAQWIAQPILRLNTAAKQLAAGNFDAKISVYRTHEVGQLAASFNQMAESLKTSFQQLKASEDKFATFLDTVPVGVSVLNHKGEIVMVNNAGKNILGQGVKPNVSFSDISAAYQVYVAGSDRLYPTERLPAFRAFQGEIVFAEDIEIHRSDGAIIPLEVRGTPVFDREGNVLYAINAFVDITERKKAEKLLADYNRILEAQVAEKTEALQRSQAQLDAFFASASVGMAIVDRNLRFVRVNEPLATIDGISVAEHIGKSLDEVVPELAPKLTPLFRQVLVKETPIFNVEISSEVPSRPGVKRYWLVSYFPVMGGEDTLYGVGAVIVEISDRKHLELALEASEARLNDILNNTVAAITRLRAFADGTWDIDYIAAGCYPVSGYTPEEIKADKDLWVRRTFPEDWQRIQPQVFGDIFAEKMGNYEYRFYHKNGSLRWLSQTNSSRWDAKQNCWLVTVISQDISDRKRAEAELERAKEVAESANRAKSAFLASMSHELRTPLNAILGFAQLMQRSSTLLPEHRNHIAIINRSGEHLLTLINDLLNMAKIEAGRTTLNEHEFNLHGFLDNLQKIFALKAKDKHLELVFSINADLPKWAIADEVKLRQVLINLLGNALKFTDVGRVTLRVFPRSSDLSPTSPPLPSTQRQTKVNIAFSVEDTGPGIPETELEDIFQPFLQTRTGKQSQEGTGLGLAIARQFVQLMGGELSVSSTLGQGSSFSFTIPLTVTEFTHKKTPLPPPPLAISLAPNQPSYRILIADDRPDNRQLLVQFLSPLGFDIKEAKDGAETLELWQGWHPHVILMDMQMPGISGWEATRQIKGKKPSPNGNFIPGENLPPTPVIIAVTASCFAEDKHATIAAGCDDAIAKPFKTADILSTLQTHLGVSYIYESETPQSLPALTDDNQLHPTEILVLSTELIQRIEQASIRAKLTQLYGAIAEIKPAHPQLAAKLQRLADAFDYQTILNSIADAKKNLPSDPK